MMTEHSLVGIDLAEVQMMTLGSKNLFQEQRKTVELKELAHSIAPMRKFSAVIFPPNISNIFEI